MASFVGSKSGIHVTFEEVLLGRDNIGADVLHGTDVFIISLTAVTGPRTETGSVLVSGGNADKSRWLQKKQKIEHRATRHTYTGDKVPLFLKMNALFIREMKKKGYLPREVPSKCLNSQTLLVAPFTPPPHKENTRTDKPDLL